MLGVLLCRFSQGSEKGGFLLKADSNGIGFHVALGFRVLRAGSDVGLALLG